VQCIQQSRMPAPAAGRAGFGRSASLLRVHHHCLTEQRSPVLQGLWFHQLYLYRRAAPVAAAVYRVAVPAVAAVGMIVVPAAVVAAVAVAPAADTVVAEDKTVVPAADTAAVGKIVVPAAVVAVDRTAALAAGTVVAAVDMIAAPAEGIVVAEDKMVAPIADMFAAHKYPGSYLYSEPRSCLLPCTRVHRWVLPHP
jgi:hypothetical protein